jgi:hypothetical protein
VGTPGIVKAQSGQFAMQVASFEGVRGLGGEMKAQRSE